MRRANAFARNGMALIVWLISHSVVAKSFTISSFNIQWYGLGGDIDGTSEKELRDPTIKKYIADHVGHPDVMAFVEIVDVARLQKNIVGNKHKCYSYAHENPKHQHVVICVNKKYKFQSARKDGDYTEMDVALGLHRPLVYGVLTDADGPIAVIGAVHLKAMPDKSDVRRRQTHIIADVLTSLDPDLPVVLVGDFNTFKTEVIDMADIYKDSGLTLAPLPEPAPYTFRKGSTKGKFDWIMATEQVEMETVTVGIPCNGPNDNSKDPFNRLSYYNKNVSDHCPVMTAIRIE